jgi:hypothetical protein
MRTSLLTLANGDPGSSLPASIVYAPGRQEPDPGLTTSTVIRRTGFEHACVLNWM